MIVVDTNILVYRWLPGAKSASADALVRSDPQWAAPLLWRSEFRNVVAGYLRKGHLSVEVAEQALSHARACLLGGEHLVSDQSVLGLVARSHCSAYDCEYVALAEGLGTFLVTEDKALLFAFPKRCRSLAQATQ